MATVEEETYICPECGEGFVSALSRGNHKMWCGKTSEERSAMFTFERRQKISEAAKKRTADPMNCPMYGRHHTEETKRKISKAKRNPSAETRQKISEATKKRLADPTNHHMYGKHHSPETIQKMSKAAYNRSSEYKQKLSEAARNRTSEHRRKLSEAGKKRFANPVDNTFYGKHHTKETKRKISEVNSGAKNGSWKGGPIEKTCELCGEAFQVRRSVLKQGKGRFCSKKCRGFAQRGNNSPSWKGGPIPYGPLWSIQRDRARNRDNYTCQRCGITEEEMGGGLSVHHIVSFRECSDNTLENLICLCGRNNGGVNCHLHCEHHPEDCPEPRKNWLLPPIRLCA